MTDINHHGRYDYTPITQRKNFDWPNGKRLAIYLGINHEIFSFGEGLGAELAPSQTSADVMNYAWRDYGNREGAWRFMEMFDRLELSTTALMNSAIVNAHPELAKACRDRGDDIAAHGESNSIAQGNLSKHEEKAMIDDSVTQLLSERDKRPLVLGIALHPYVMVQSHRALHLERVLRKLREQNDSRIWWTTAGEISAYRSTIIKG